MSALAVVIRILSEDADITAPAYPVVIPADADLPCIVASLIYEDQDVLLAGATDAYSARVSVACLAATATGANDLGEAVKAALGGVANRVVQTTDSPPATIATATILKEGTDVTDYDDARTVFRRLMDFSVRWWRPA